MKKRLLACLLLCTALLLALPLAAGAEAKLDYVNDYTGILSAETRDALNTKAAQVSQQYGCGVYVVVVDDYKGYVNGGMENFSEAIYKTYELGEGEGKNGILLSLSMNDRDFDLCAYGDFGNYAFTDYGKGQLENTFLDNFRADDWAGGFADYIDNCGVLLARAKNGDPLDTWIPDPAPRGITPGEAMIIIAVPCLLAGAVVSGFKRQMKTAVKQTRAENYISHSGLQLSDRSDQFINRSVTRHPVPKATSSGPRPSGGHAGGTTVNSGGFSHHSGKF
ncbi:MAG: TPM domain-containing protein [Oscillospiraceae bacterium]|nr:TPM domain-containing protein [Oscillospiraceae bacterium]